MITPKFDYTPLSRESINGSRYYCLPNGDRVPSVTTILDGTKPKEDKEALQNWRNAIGVDRAREITTMAANRGTRMHSYLEHYICSGTVKERGSNPYCWASHDMAKVVIDRGLKNIVEVWGSEAALYFPKVYAGTADGIGLHRNSDGSTDMVIFDFKQTNKPKSRERCEDYFLQLAAYAVAHNEVYQTKIAKGVILMCVKPELDADQKPLTVPEYQEFILEASDFSKYEKKWWGRVDTYYSNLSKI